MEWLDKLNWRYATKAMNGEKVPQEKIDNITRTDIKRITTFWSDCDYEPRGKRKDYTDSI